MSLIKVLFLFLFVRKETLVVSLQQEQHRHIRYTTYRLQDTSHFIFLLLHHNMGGGEVSSLILQSCSFSVPNRHTHTYTQIELTIARPQQQTLSAEDRKILEDAHRNLNNPDHPANKDHPKVGAPTSSSPSVIIIIIVIITFMALIMASSF